MRQLAFYCVCDRKHFLGLAALVNSLRVLGHDETVFVLDCGLATWQRALLDRDGEVVVIDAASSIHPMLLKTILPLEHPAETMVVVDVDVIFTDRLDALVSLATESGKPVLFPDLGYPERFEPAWEDLGFGAPVPHHYVASGQLVLPASVGRAFLETWSVGLRRLASNPALAGYGKVPDNNPFYFPDMDVLNALIGPAISLDGFVLADTSTVAYPPFEGVRIVDLDRLVVEARDGSRPILLHHYGDKPWNRFVPPNAYSILMTRLLSSHDAAVRTPRYRIPYALRAGVAPRSYVASRLLSRHYLRGRLGVRPRIARFLGRLRPAARAG